MKPLVSVIVACHNASPYIDECLESLVSQTYQNFEIIICDDASSDDSWNKLQKWSEKDPRVHLLQNETNMGAGYTRNKCLGIAFGDFHMIQDIDDISGHDRMEILVDTLLKEPDISFVSSLMHPFDQDGSRSKVMFEGKGRRKEYPSKWDFLWVLPFAHATSMFRREVLLAVHGYQTSKAVERQEDYDMMMRIYAKGYLGKNLKEILYYYRYNNSNIQRISNQSISNYMKIRYQGFKEMGLFPWAVPFVLKPLLSHFFHKMLLISGKLK